MSSKSLKDRIDRWRGGSEGFFKFLDDVKPMIPSSKGGYEVYEVPSEHIRQEIAKALDGDFSTLVFCWPRRHGKTVVTSLIIIWRFLSRRTQEIAIVSNSERQTVDTAFRLVRDILKQTPYSAKLIDDGVITIGADAISFPALGNLIQAHPSNSAALYGKKLSVVQVSELHAAKSGDMYATMAGGTIDTEGSLRLVDSTVGPRTSPLFGLYNLWKSGADPALYFSYITYRDLKDHLENGPSWIGQKQLKSLAAQLLPHQFQQQHLNQWTSTASALFPPDILEACTDKYPLEIDAIAQGAAYAVGGGLDRAYGFSIHGDATVACCALKVVFDGDEHYYVLACDEIMFSRASGIRKAFKRYYDDFGMKSAAIESYNAQDVAAWASEQPFDSETIHPTLERKSNAFTAVFNAAREGRLHIAPRFQKLLDEMATFEYQLESGGTAKFHHAKGFHDDYVDALVWAIYSLRDYELNPFELNGIVCREVGPASRLCILNGGELAPMCSDSCRSFTSFNALYQRYLNNPKEYHLEPFEFFREKVKNTGIHSVRR